MGFTIVVIFAVFALTGGAKIAPRIIGGNDAEDGNFPYQVSLRYSDRNTHFCGGTIIGSQHILTSATCIYGKQPEDIIVVAGTMSLSDGGDTYQVEKLIVHDDYEPFDVVNNIGFIKLSNQIQYDGDRVGKIAIETTNVGGDEEVTLSGWGSISYPNEEKPDRLQFLKLKTISNDECAGLWVSGQISDEDLCTEPLPGVGACNGDFGSPLVHNFQLSGIVSWGRPCASGVPDVYTRISKYSAWIMDQFDK